MKLKCFRYISDIFNSSKKQGLSYVLILLILFTSLPFKSYALDDNRLKIGISYWEYSPVIAIAKEKGYFTKYNLNISTVSYNNTMTALNEMCNKKLNIVTSSEYTFVSNSSANKNIRIISSIASLNMLQTVVRKNSKIRKFTDLKNKSVAVVAATQSEFELVKMLTYNGMSLKDIKKVSIPPNNFYQDLITKKVDAIITTDRVIYELEQNLKDDFYIIPKEFPQDYQWLIVGKETDIKKSPSKYKRFISALIDAQTFLRNNPEESKKIVVKYSGFSLSYIESIWNKVETDISLNQSLIVGLEDQSRWQLLSNKSKAKIPNYLNFINMEILNSVQPNAVGIIH